MITLRQAAWASLLLHAGIGVVLILTSHSFLRPQPLQHTKEANRPVMVDFVRVGPRSAAPILGAPSAGGAAKPNQSRIPPKDKAPTQSRPQPKPQATPAPRQEVCQNRPTVQTKPERKPVPKAQSKPAAKPVSKPTPKAPSTQAPKPPIQPTKTPDKKPSKTPPKPTAKPGSASSTSRRAKVDLTQRSAAGSMDELLKNVPTGAKGVGGNPNAAFAETYGEELTGTDIDLLNRHMKQFWNMPSGHEKAYNIVVEVELFIRKDGTIEKANLVDLERYRRDPEYRIAAESALRAVLDPDCSPLPLDPAKYKQWQHMIFVFDPREMCR